MAPEVWDDAVAATGAATVTLSDTELANFRPFVQVQTPTGNRWSEVVRPQAVADFDAILKMNVPDDLAQFVGSVDPVTKRPILPKLDDEVLRIAQLPGAGGEAGPTWYSGLGVPYLVGSLSNVTDDPGAAMLNAKRSRMWMRTIMPSAPVYKVQMPALYAYRYGKNNPQGKNPAIQGYLDDQALTSPNHVAHVAEVTADAVAWKQQMTAGMPNVKPEDIKAFTDIVDELSALGEQGCYWAYRLFRFATSPAALSEVHGLSLSPAQDSSLLAVRVQSTCATLSVLDPSGTFTKEYVKVISLVQLTNVLPQLLNYAGYADGVRAMVPQLVEAFIAEHLDSTDPDIQEAVKQLQDAVDRNQVLDLVNDILGVGAALSGAYQWSRLLSKLGKYPGGIGVIAGSVITAAVAAAGLAMFVYGCLNWNSLSTEARANLVVGAIQIVFDMAMSIIKFGGKLAGIWSPEVGRWERMIALINPFRTEADAVQERIQGRTMRRILDRANQGDYADAGEWEEMQIFRAERDAEVGDEPDAALDEFGLNLEPFELGVGFVFALFNLIMAAIAVSESTDPLDKAQNGLFLASSILDGVAYAVGFASTFVEVAAETAALIASIVSACTIFASILAAIGLAITIAVMSAPHDTPIETFAKGDAKDIGFDMPLGYAIESFEAYAPQQGPSFAAVTVSGPGSGANVLHVAADGTLAYAAPDQTSATCWYLTVDGNGQARLSSANPVTNKVVCLAVTRRVSSPRRRSTRARAPARRSCGSRRCCRRPRRAGRTRSQGCSSSRPWPRRRSTSICRVRSPASARRRPPPSC